MDAELAREVQSLAAMAGGQELELMRQGLESLARVAPYDLATVFALEGQDLVVKAAHGALADERVARHRISLLEFPSVREAIESGHGRAFTADDHAHGDGDPFDGVLDLPDGHACMVVPLAASEQVLGVLTLDRSECVAYSRATVELVEIYARLLAHAIRNAKLSAALAQLSEQRLEHAKELEDRLVGETVLEESLSPAVKRVAEL
ncbi:MAG: GAF domain-containing protein, partial [Sandaracinaceae bacterium]|nr:GAF domain-containing protein [Sandaracinaceae bacterium]